MERNRLLQLALEELQRQKAGVDEEIAAIRAELTGIGSDVPQVTPLSSTAIRRKRTPAERKAQAEKMRKYWAAKKTRAAKSAFGTKAQTTAANAKTRTKTDAERNALSLKMKEAWKKRKAAAAKAVEK